ncbi:MAG TPA: M20/M25/M40 family metallo-hydrolase [Bryobacteraceae bacterium]|nr:M20/M25/M40 family metallo-hydrolase [Bryobacteraceae bacterium]
MQLRATVSLLVLSSATVWAQSASPLGERARQYLVDLIRLDTSSPPGNETRVATYLKRIAEENGIPGELLGDTPERLNFVARLKGSGAGRPLLLMAHSDVVPADRTQWTADPFGAEIRNGEIYGRGTQDTKGLLAAELAVFLELKNRGVKLKRDVILLSEADEESGSAGIQWLIANAPAKIDAEFALNEGGALQELASGIRLFQVQTTEKIPTRVVLTARGTAGHGSLPRPDNPLMHLSRALARLDAHQPVRFNATTRRYMTEIALIPEYAWAAPLLARLSDPGQEAAASEEIRARDPELDAQLHTTIAPTMLRAGMKINVIPNVAEAQVDVRRLPNESREEVIERIRRLVNDPAVEVAPAPGQDMPATEPSATSTTLYTAMEKVFLQSNPRAKVVPFMLRGATDGAFLREKGMAVYGVPLFAREGLDSRAHGNDERISVANLAAGTEMLWQIVMDVAAE